MTLSGTFDGVKTGSSMHFRFYSRLSLFTHLLTSIEVCLGTKPFGDLKKIYTKLLYL